MSIEALLSRLEAESQQPVASQSVTPVTPAENKVLHLQPLKTRGCTPVTPVTPEKTKSDPKTEVDKASAILAEFTPRGLRLSLQADGLVLKGDATAKDLGRVAWHQRELVRLIWKQEQGPCNVQPDFMGTGRCMLCKHFKLPVPGALEHECTVLPWPEALDRQRAGWPCVRYKHA